MIKPSYNEVPFGLTLRNIYDPLNGAGTFDATGAGFAFPQATGLLNAFLAGGYTIGGGQWATPAGVISLGAKKALGFGFGLVSPVDLREADFVSCSILCGPASALSFAGFAGYYEAFAALGTPSEVRLCNLTSYQSSPGGSSWSGVLRPNMNLADFDADGVDFCAGMLVYNPGTTTVTITGLCMTMEHTHFGRPDDGETGVLIVQ